MTPMATSNSTNVNAREALIEFARQRMSMAYHGVLIGAKHLFQDFTGGVKWKGVLPKWNGARVSHPQQPRLPNERTKFHEFWGSRTCCGWDSRAPNIVSNCATA